MAAKNRFNPIACRGAALPDEEYVGLLARDPAFPGRLAIWAGLRVGNLAAATENFRMMLSGGLLEHYRDHPDVAKSEEAIATANRGAEWRAANLNGPNGKPTWKDSLVRPQMLRVDPKVVEKSSPSGEWELYDLVAGRVVSHTGTADDAIEYALSRFPFLGDGETFLHSWREGKLDAYPDFLKWLEERRPVRKHPALGEPYGGERAPDDETQGDMS